MSNTLVEQQRCSSRNMIPNKKIPNNMLCTFDLTSSTYGYHILQLNMKIENQKNPSTKQQSFSTTETSSVNMNKLDKVSCRKLKFLELCVHVTGNNALVL